MQVLGNSIFNRRFQVDFSIFAPMSTVKLLNNQDLDGE